MKLPQLPRAAIDEHNLQGGRLLYAADQIRAYGEACARAALEEASKVCDVSNRPPNVTPTDCARAIRAIEVKQ